MQEIYRLMNPVNRINVCMNDCMNRFCSQNNLINKKTLAFFNFAEFGCSSIFRNKINYRNENCTLPDKPNYWQFRLQQRKNCKGL